MHETNAAAELRSSRRLKGYLTATISLSRAQALAGFVAALLSIAGTLVGYVNTMRAQYGALLMLVHDRQTNQPVPDAIVEVLTPTDALVTTFPTPHSNAAARHSLKEGMYRVRVTNPRFAPETRVVQVIGGETSEIRFLLSPRPPSTSDRPAGAIAPAAATRAAAKAAATAGSPAKPGASRSTATKPSALRSAATRPRAMRPVAGTTVGAPKWRPGGAPAVTNAGSGEGPRGLRQDTP